MTLHILRSNVVIILAASFIGIVLVGHYFVDIEKTKFFLQSLVFGVALANSLSWRRAAFDAFRNKVSDGSDNIILTIWVIWTILTLWFPYLIYYVQTGRTEWVRDLPVTDLIYASIFLAGAMSLLAPLNTQNPVERPALWSIVIAAIIGGLVAGVLLTLLVLGIIRIT